jgi:tetratricopeptide (TPR) repeat protein
VWVKLSPVGGRGQGARGCAAPQSLSQRQRIFRCLILILICAATAGLSLARPEAGDALFSQALPNRTDGDSRSILVRAIQLHQAGKFDEAIREYRKCLALDPENFVARANLGAALAHQGKYAEAIEEYKRALKLRPGNPEVELNLALAHYKAMQLNEAARELAPLHRAAPENLRITLLLGDCYFRLGDYEKTVALLKPLEAAEPQSEAVDYLLGMSLIQDKQVVQGEILVNKILRNGDSAVAHLMLGEAHLAIGDTAGAIDELTQALKLDPKIPLAHWLYGRALLEAGSRVKAMQAFQEELAIDPNEFQANLYLAYMLNQEHKYKDALPYLSHALQVRPGSPRAEYQIAVAQIGMENLGEAGKTLDALVAQSPNFLEAHVSLAAVCYRLHNKQEGDRESAIVAKLNAEIEAHQTAQVMGSNYHGPAGPPEPRAQDPVPGAKNHKPVAPPPQF